MYTRPQLQEIAAGFIDETKETLTFAVPKSLVDDPAVLCLPNTQHCVPSYQATLLCNEYMSYSMDLMYMGVSGLAAMGFIYFVYYRLENIYYNMRHVGAVHLEDVRSVVLIIVSIYAHGYYTSEGGMRWLTVVGLVLAYRELLFVEVRRRVYDWAARLGEVVEEYQLEEAQ